MIALAEYPPQVSLTLEAMQDAAFYIARRRTLVIYHSTGDRIVALYNVGGEFHVAVFSAHELVASYTSIEPAVVTRLT